MICGKIRKAALALLSACLIMLFTGCSFGMSGDTLLASPRLTDEQNEIYTALTASVGSVNLRYPHTGEHRSAFVIHNLDSEPTNEAIVFYEKKGDPASADLQTVSGLRVGFLDMDENGKWQSVYEMSAKGSGINSVTFSKLGSDKERLLISYTLPGSSDKLMSVLDYSAGKAVLLGTVNYSACTIQSGIPAAGSEFLACFNRDAANKAATFSTYKINEKGVFEQLYPSVSLNGNITQFDRITASKCLIMGKETDCIAVDYLCGENLYGTDMLYFAGSSFETAATVVRDGKDTVYQRRSNAYTPKVNSADIDSDGILDVPVTSPLPGYEKNTYPEQLCAVIWYRQNCDKIEAGAYTYVDKNGDYILTFPGRWVGMVTATANASENSVTFWKYEGSLEANKYPLLTVKTVLKTAESQSQPTTRDGYRKFYEDDEMSIFVKGIMYEGLSLTEDEIAAALTVIPKNG